MRVKALLAVLALSAGRGGAADTPPSAPLVSAPAKNWSLPLFTAEGYRSMTLRGSEVHPISSDRIDVVDINITTFSGDASVSVVSSLLSPVASFFPRENRASGPQSVRVIRFGQGGEISAEITGEDWTYEQAGEKVSIRRNAHVVFEEPLTDILK
jgi:hypothetical protein